MQDIPWTFNLFKTLDIVTIHQHIALLSWQLQRLQCRGYLNSARNDDIDDNDKRHSAESNNWNRLFFSWRLIVANRSSKDRHACKFIVKAEANSCNTILHQCKLANCIGIVLVAIDENNRVHLISSTIRQFSFDVMWAKCVSFCMLYTRWRRQYSSSARSCEHALW